MSGAGVPLGGTDIAALERSVREAMDAAGIQGLCREGQIEAAVGAVRALHPEWPAATALAVVRRIAIGAAASPRRRP